MLRRLLAVPLVAAVAACSAGVGAEMWMCSVSLTLGDVTASGRGSGGSEDAALSAAFAQACAGLPISGETLQACRRGENFSVSTTSGNITFVDPAERSVRCEGSW